MRNRDDIECWLTDMDGVLVHENHPVPGAAELLAQWTKQGKPFLCRVHHDRDQPRLRGVGRDPQLLV